MGGRGICAVLLGAPGSGKGTQAERLSAALGIPAISTGEMLRQEVARGSAVGGRVSAVMASGRLVDDELMAQVVRERLRRPDAAAGFVLDGYPRTPAQAEMLDALLAEGGLEVTAVVLLDVPERVLVRRALARKRQDDREEVVRRRLEVYREKTEPLIAHYEGRGLLSRIDGDRPVEVITHDALAVLGER